MNNEFLKQIILKNKLLETNRLRELEGLAITSNRSLFDSIVVDGNVREDDIMSLVGKELGIPMIDVDDEDIYTSALFEDLPNAIKKSGDILPMYKQDDVVTIAVTDPLNVKNIDLLRRDKGWKLVLKLITPKKLKEYIQKITSDSPILAEQHIQVDDSSGSERSLEELANEAPIVKLVNLIIMQGISDGASDIHIEPYEKEAVVRYRVDGVLRESARHEMPKYPAIISRIKILSDLDIAERRIPQDGRISMKMLGKVYDLRVATVPCLFGEGVVMRILDKGSIQVELEDLGFSENMLKSFMKEISSANGIVLVTGPTGSGKTTTLYSSLNKIKSEATKIITVEDPVEYNLEGINQIPVNSQVGMTFAAGLRSILRLDPDIVMVGEIRDEETATIAIRAALTGHLVFSTLHTNDSIGAVTRLIDMGVPSYLVAASVNAVLAQRLVRKMCKKCSKEQEPDDATKSLFKSMEQTVPNKIMIAEGCDACKGRGYKGRLGIYEIFQVDDEIRERLSDGISMADLRHLAAKKGFISMREDGSEKVRSALTTAQEIIRVTQE